MKLECFNRIKSVFGCNKVRVAPADDTAVSGKSTRRTKSRTYLNEKKNAPGANFDLENDNLVDDLVHIISMDAFQLGGSYYLKGLKAKPRVDVPSEFKENYDFIAVLGKGAFAKVMLVRKKASKKLYALKIMSKKNILLKNINKRIVLERKLLSNMNHPYITRLHSSFQTRQKVFIVMEFCHGGELKFHLKQRGGKFSLEATLFYAAQLFVALAFIHSNGTAYRDLKPENILLDAKGNIRISDFGLAKQNVHSWSEGADTMCGTPPYMAPEVIVRNAYGFSCDYWSAGIVFYEMMTSVTPFRASTAQQVFHNTVRMPIKIARTWSEDTKDFLRCILCKLPERRLGCLAGTKEEVFAHPAFATVDIESIENFTAKPPIVPEPIQLTESNDDKCSDDKNSSSLSGRHRRGSTGRGPPPSVGRELDATTAKRGDQPLPQQPPTGDQNRGHRNLAACNMAAIEENDERLLHASRLLQQQKRGEHEQQPPHHHQQQPLANRGTTTARRLSTFGMLVAGNRESVHSNRHGTEGGGGTATVGTLGTLSYRGGSTQTGEGATPALHGNGGGVPRMGTTGTTRTGTTATANASASASATASGTARGTSTSSGTSSIRLNVKGLDKGSGTEKKGKKAGASGGGGGGGGGVFSHGRQELLEHIRSVIESDRNRVRIPLKSVSKLSSWRCGEGEVIDPNNGNKRTSLSSFGQGQESHASGVESEDNAAAAAAVAAATAAGGGKMAVNYGSSHSSKSVSIGSKQYFSEFSCISADSPISVSKRKSIQTKRALPVEYSLIGHQSPWGPYTGCSSNSAGRSSAGGGSVVGSLGGGAGANAALFNGHFSGARSAPSLAKLRGLARARSGPRGLLLRSHQSLGGSVVGNLAGATGTGGGGGAGGAASGLGGGGSPLVASSLKVASRMRRQRKGAGLGAGVISGLTPVEQVVGSRPGRGSLFSAGSIVENVELL